jgi:AcrR family transcriptional regulator
MVTGGRKTRWGDREARERDIRAAALELLEHGGYRGLSMRAVAEGAEVSLGTLYLYFASKDALYATLYVERLQRLGGEIEAACAGAASLEAALATSVVLYLDVYRVFGREVDPWMVDHGPASTAGLVEAALAVFDGAWTSLERLDPTLAEVPDERRRLALQLVWVTVTGLAEHLTGARAHLYGHPRRLIDQAVEVLVAGLRAIVL